MIALSTTSSDNSYLISGSEDCTIRVWNTLTGQCTQTLAAHADHVCSLVQVPLSRWASCSWDKTIRLWMRSHGTVTSSCAFTCCMTLKGHTDVVDSLAVLCDGQLVSASWDKTLRVWDTSTGACVKILQGHTGGVDSLVPISGACLASGSSDNTIRIWR